MAIATRGTCALIAGLCLALGGMRTAAQDAATNSAAQPQTAAAVNSPAAMATPAQPVAAQPTAKVWTNDDVSSLRSDEPVSTAAKKNAKGAGAKPAAAAAKSKSPAPYRDQINRLEAQIPPIDSQISQLQGALAGQTSTAPRKFVGVRPDDWQAELDQLQKKRGGIEDQIQAVRDQARHAGVPANALP